MRSLLTLFLLIALAPQQTILARDDNQAWQLIHIEADRELAWARSCLFSTPKTELMIFVLSNMFQVITWFRLRLGTEPWITQ
jgi:hypothetical protein